MATLNGKMILEREPYVSSDGTVSEANYPELKQHRFLPPPGCYWVRGLKNRNALPGSSPSFRWILAEVSGGGRDYFRFRMMGNHEGECRRWEVDEAEWIGPVLNPDEKF